VLLALFTIACAAGVAWATGATMGAGLRSGGHGVRWSTVSNLVAAWVITLPASAAVSAATWWFDTQF
jgi:PiT family inorganic phosphate transporter